MQVQPYLFFDGRCEEALNFYSAALGAQVTALMRFKDAPPSASAPGCTPPPGDKIMHANLQIGPVQIMASDGMVPGEGAFKDVYSVMANWGANHGSFSYGHIGAKLITLASMLRIPVAMHNVPADKVFRPHAWSAFGTVSSESADYRACETYGPLFG